MHDPRFASRERLTHLRTLADQRSGAANHIAEQIRNLHSEKQRLDRRRSELEGLPGAPRIGAKEPHRQLTAQIEGIDADIAELTPIRDRLSREHATTRATFDAALRRARELGLATPIDASGDEFAPEPTRFPAAAEVPEQGVLK